MRYLILTICLFSFAAVSEASTIIAAKVVRNQAGSGSCLISSGFPVPPGLVTETLVTQSKIKVLIGATEVAANVSALRGRHADGTVRSLLIQFTRSMAQNDELTASVIVDGGVQTYAAPAYVRPTYEMVENNNIIVSTDKNYLATTGISLRGLIPTGSGTTDEERLYTLAAENRFDALMISTPGYIPVSSYDQVEAIISLWARTGDIKYQKAAVAHTLQLLPYNTPLPGYTPAGVDVFPKVNPDSRNPSGAQALGIPNEPQYARYFGYAQMYLLTGYRDFWGMVAWSVQNQQSAISSQSLAYSKILEYHKYDTPRYNAWGHYGSLIPALMIDATIPVTGPYNTGRAYNWDNQLTWTIDTFDHWKWDFKWIPFNSGSGIVYTGNDTTQVTGTVTQGGVTATLLGVYPLMHDEQTFAGSAMPTTGYLMVNNITGGSFTAGALTISGGISATSTGNQITDYREGMVAGVRQNSPRGNYAPFTGDHNIPYFQLLFPTNFMIDTYLYIKADSRIPALVKKNLDVMLAGIRTKQSGDVYYSSTGGSIGGISWGDHIYTKNYALENPPQLDSLTFSTGPGGNATIPFELPEYARVIAFVLKTSGEDTVNGATYSQWYQRCIDISNVSPSLLTWGWKYFGQFYSWGMDAPWMMAQSSLTNYGPATLRTPTQYNAIPGDVPDIGPAGTSTPSTVRASGRYSYR